MSVGITAYIIKNLKICDTFFKLKIFCAFKCCLHEKRFFVIVLFIPAIGIFHEGSLKRFSAYLNLNIFRLCNNIRHTENISHSAHGRISSVKSALFGKVYSVEYSPGIIYLGCIMHYAHKCIELLSAIKKPRHINRRVLVHSVYEVFHFFIITQAVFPIF